MAGLWRKSPEQYDGLEIRCAPGVHAAAADLLHRHAVPKDGVLDLGSGSGAFLARLRDQGYTDLVAVERGASRFHMAGVQPMAIDLEGDFARQIGGQFGLITAIEIIEHLESPLRFLKEAAALLSPGGCLLLSTPNVTAWQSRVKFLLRGELRYFDVAQYRYQRHISPILPSLLPHLLAEAGLETVEATAAGTFDGAIKRAVFWLPAMAVAGRGPFGRGECLVALARKAQETACNSPEMAVE